MKRTIALIVAPPLVVAVIVIVELLALAPGLPTELATHWGPGGLDGTGTVVDLIVPVAIIVPSITALVVVLVLVTSRRGSSTVLERSAIVVNVFAGSGVALTLLAIAVPQRGVTNLRSVAPAPWVVGAFAVALVLAAGCALLSRHVPVRPATSSGEPVHELALAETERAVWSRSVTAAIGVQVVVLAAGVIVLVVVWIAGAAWVALLEAVLFAVVVSTLHWRVTVTREGILVRSVLGVPRFRVPIGDVVEARAIPVGPLRQFGGGGSAWEASDGESSCERATRSRSRATAGRRSSSRSTMRQRARPLTTFARAAHPSS